MNVKLGVSHYEGLPPVVEQILDEYAKPIRQQGEYVTYILDAHYVNWIQDVMAKEVLK